MGIKFGNSKIIECFIHSFVLLIEWYGSKKYAMKYDGES